jgi:exodeoxyribonuclease V alpha subunit
MNRASAGTQVLNNLCQKLLNASETTGILVKGVTVKKNDRVMQITNNYEKNVFNGDIGQIIKISHEMIDINFSDRVVQYENYELDQIVLAYATTVHKSQGSEFDAVIMPIFTQHFTLLQRNLIYTAITRAKKLCIIIGQTKAIAMAINNNKNVKRLTFLKKMLLN